MNKFVVYHAYITIYGTVWGFFLTGALGIAHKYMYARYLYMHTCILCVMSHDLYIDTKCLKLHFQLSFEKYHSLYFKLYIM